MSISSVSKASEDRERGDVAVDLLIIIIVITTTTTTTVVVVVTIVTII